MLFYELKSRSPRLFLSLSQTQAFIQDNTSDIFGFEFSLYNLYELEQSHSTNFIPLEIEEEQYLYLAWGDNKSDAIAFCVYSILKDHLSRFSMIYHSESKRKDLEIAVSLIPTPLALYDGSNQLLVHNKSFIDLNISSKECLDFRHGQQLTVGKETFRVLKKQWDDKLLFSFISVQDVISSDKQSSEELGIITSSVAHELNNPLAGVLAALEVFLLDDLDDELNEKIQEMKTSLIRCKKLVETFLGFSKVQVDGDVNRFLKPRVNDIEFSLGQAMELVRFRLVENNISLNIDFSRTKPLETAIHGPMMTMIMYLILGDVVTNMAHHGLVVREKRNRLDLTLREDRNNILLKFSEKGILGTDVMKSKLFTHLVQSQGFNFFYSDDCIEFRV